MRQSLKEVLERHIFSTMQYILCSDERNEDIRSRRYYDTVASSTMIHAPHCFGCFKRYQYFISYSGYIYVVICNLHYMIIYITITNTHS
jgi:hypothetical protein